MSYRKLRVYVVLVIAACLGVFATVHYLKPYVGAHFRHVVWDAVRDEVREDVRHGVEEKLPDVLRKFNRNINPRMEAIACDQTAAFVMQNMSKVQPFEV